MHARIVDGACVEFIQHNPEGLYHPSIRWAPVPAFLERFAVLGYIEQERAAAPPSLDFLREQVKALATSQRKQIEAAGITLADGSRILTAKEDQDRIDTALANMERYAIKSLDFKAASGFVTLGYDQLKAIGAAVVAHVQGCFTAEMKHHAAIDALQDAEAVASYDYSSGWPTGKAASAESHA